MTYTPEYALIHGIFSLLATGIIVLLLVLFWQSITRRSRAYENIELYALRNVAKNKLGIDLLKESKIDKLIKDSKLQEQNSFSTKLEKQLIKEYFKEEKK